MDSSVEDPGTLGIVADLECPSPPTRSESLPADGVAAGDRPRLHQPLRPPDPSRSARVRRILMCPERDMCDQAESQFVEKTTG